MQQVLLWRVNVLSPFLQFSFPLSKGPFVSRSSRRHLGFESFPCCECLSASRTMNQHTNMVCSWGGNVDATSLIPTVGGRFVLTSQGTTNNGLLQGLLLCALIIMRMPPRVYEVSLPLHLARYLCRVDLHA